LILLGGGSKSSRRPSSVKRLIPRLQSARLYPVYSPVGILTYIELKNKQNCIKEYNQSTSLRDEPAQKSTIEYLNADSSKNHPQEMTGLGGELVRSPVDFAPGMDLAGSQRHFLADGVCCSAPPLARHGITALLA